MLGKSLGLVFKKGDLLTVLIAVASILFFFSDFMLVFDWFTDIWDYANIACMGTYYPALCLLAFSIYIKTTKFRKD